MSAATDELIALEGLIGSSGWSLYVAEAEDRQRSREAEVIGGTLDHDRYIQATGEIAAVRGTLAWPGARIEFLRNMIEETEQT